MAFNSFEFIAFVCILVPLFYAAPARRRVGLLLVASITYYTLAAGPWVFLLLATIAATYALGRRAAAATGERRRVPVLVGAILVLGALVFFKYTPETVGGSRTGWLATWGNLAVPLGISYYSFKLLSYLIEAGRGRCPADTTLARFATYAAFFPQVPSGPIQRSRDFMPQLDELDRDALALIRRGVLRATIGFVKKLVFADRIALTIAPVFADPAAASPVVVLLAAYLFTLQLYLDFSGLTDIAVGVGRVLQIEAPGNFTDPFFAPTVQEFWARWHITLTGWLRDYVFLPLNMALRGLGRLGLSLAVTVNMLLIGIWHGATWPFVIFGLLHAAYLVCGTLTRARRDRWFARGPWLRRVRRPLGALLTFHLVVIAFVFFRADDAALATSMIARAASVPGQPSVPPVTVLAVLIAGILATIASHLLDRRPGRLGMVGWKYAAFMIGLLLLLYAFAPAESVSFVYVGF